MRLTGPPVETIQLEAELDAMDKVEYSKQNQDAVEFGLHPELVALESIVELQRSSCILERQNTPCVIFGAPRWR